MLGLSGLLVRYSRGSSYRSFNQCYYNAFVKKCLNVDGIPLKISTVNISQSRVNYVYDKEKHLTEEDKKSIFYLFKPDVGFGTDFIAFLHKKKDFSWSGIKKWYSNLQENAKVHDQRYIPKRHQVLGPDLATAHFIVYRNGSVRFQGYDDWVKKDEKGHVQLPKKHVPNLYLEAVDASGTNLMYEGFDNFVNLYYLKHLNLSNCSYIDDWCLDRLTEFKDTLEHLDISGCQNITERGILSLHRLRNLKYLNVSDLPNFHNKELVCLLLEDVLPKCQIVGVDYLNTTVLEEKQIADLTEKMTTS